MSLQKQKSPCRAAIGAAGLKPGIPGCCCRPDRRPIARLGSIPIWMSEHQCQRAQSSRYLAALVLLWCCSGVALVLLSCCSRVPLALLWCCSRVAPGNASNKVRALRKAGRLTILTPSPRNPSTHTHNRHNTQSTQQRRKPAASHFSPPHPETLDTHTQQTTHNQHNNNERRLPRISHPLTPKPRTPKPKPSKNVSALRPPHVSHLLTLPLLTLRLLLHPEAPHPLTQTLTIH